MFDTDLHNKLPVISSNQERLKSYLISEDSKNIWYFLISPSSIRYTFSNSYQVNKGLFAIDHSVKFQSTDLVKLSVDALMTTPSHKRSLLALVQSLNNLRLPDTETNHLSALTLVIYNRVIPSLYIESISVNETELYNGDPTTVEMTLTFISGKNRI